MAGLGAAKKVKDWLLASAWSSLSRTEAEDIFTKISSKEQKRSREQQISTLWLLICHPPLPLCRVTFSFKGAVLLACGTGQVCFLAVQNGVGKLFASARVIPNILNRHIGTTT